MNGAWRRIRQILKKELRQTLREPRLRALVIGPPLIQLLIFGYAVNLDVDNSRIAWMDQDRSPASRRLQAAFEGSPGFRIVATPRDDRQLQDLMDRGRVQGVVRVLAGFQRDLERGDTAQVQILVDGTNSNTASIIALVSQSHPVAAASSTIAVTTELRVRAASGMAMASRGSRSAMQICFGSSGSAACESDCSTSSSSSSSDSPIRCSSHWWMAGFENRHSPATLRPGNLPRSASRTTC